MRRPAHCSRLFTTYYPERRRERGLELDLCLALNSLAFDRLYVLAENVSGPSLQNCDWQNSKKRQTYADLLAWASSVAADDDLTIIANCDIVIPRDSIKTIDGSLQAGEAYCLARHEVTQGGGLALFDVNYSQDVWAFRGRPPVGIGSYFFGIPGCDNRFAQELATLGLRVSNPARDIPTIHVHGSGRRTVTNSRPYRLPPPYLFINPTRLGETPVTVAKEAAQHAIVQG